MLRIEPHYSRKYRNGPRPRLEPLSDELLKIIQLNTTELSQKGQQARSTFEKHFRVEQKAEQFVKTLLSF